MTRHPLLILFTAIVCTAMAIAGCTENDCPTGSANELKIRFLSVADTTDFSIDTLTVTAEGTDSVLLNREIGISYITLPLNGTSLTTTYTFHFTMLSRDTIQTTSYLPDGTMEIRDTVVTAATRYTDVAEINYSAQQLFTSMDCGLVYSFELQSGRHSTNFIKSMGIVNTQISEDNEENIYMFF